MGSIKEQLLYLKEHLSFGRVFAYYGRPWKGDFTHQYSCDLHGDGEDHTPSARYYSDTRLVKCYACEDGNNGGDVCWYIKKREKFKTYREVLDFVRIKFGIGMAAADLPQRIALNNQLQAQRQAQNNLRETFKKQVVDFVNDQFFELGKRIPLESTSRLHAVQRIVFEELQKADKLQVGYVEYANALRTWQQWALQVIAAVQSI